MIDREPRPTQGLEQEQLRESARNMQTLLIDSIGIKTSLRERPTYHDSILIPDRVSFYVPQQHLDTDRAFKSLQYLRPDDITYVADTTLQEWMDGVSLVHVFEKDLSTAHPQLHDSAKRQQNSAK